MIPKIIDILADWENKNGCLSAIFLHEWENLRDAVTEAAVDESPRMARAALQGLSKGYWKVSASYRVWIGGDYNGSWSTDYRSWVFPTEDAALKFVPPGKPERVDPPRFVTWDA